MKPPNTRCFWVRSTKNINLWLIITCIFFLQGYSESSLPWTRHGCAVQIAFLSSRGRSVPFAVSHTDTCVYGSRPNVGRMQRHVMNVQPPSLLNKLGDACRVLHFWPIRPVIFPIIPECFQCSLNAVTTFFRFSFGDDNYLRSSAAFPVFLAAYVYLANTEMLSQTSMYHISYTFVANAEMSHVLYLSRKRWDVQLLILVL